MFWRELVIHRHESNVLVVSCESLLGNSSCVRGGVKETCARGFRNLVQFRGYRNQDGQYHVSQSSNSANNKNSETKFALISVLALQTCTNVIINGGSLF